MSDERTSDERLRERNRKAAQRQLDHDRDAREKQFRETGSYLQLMPGDPSYEAARKAAGKKKAGKK